MNYALCIVNWLKRQPNYELCIMNYELLKL